MERAGHPVVLQVATGGDHLHVQGELSAPLDLTEIRRPAGPHQSLQLAVALGTHDLDLQISAAGGAATVVGGTAGCAGAGVLAPEHRKGMAGSGWRREGPGDQALGLDQLEPVPAEPARLFPAPARATRGPPVAEQSALLCPPIGAEVATGHMEDRFHVQIPLAPPEIAERDALSMAPQPGGLVVERLVAILQRSDA
jgi:hypothetical protein